MLLTDIKNLLNINVLVSIKVKLDVGIIIMK